MRLFDDFVVCDGMCGRTSSNALIVEYTAPYGLDLCEQCMPPEHKALNEGEPFFKVPPEDMIDDTKPVKRKSSPKVPFFSSASSSPVRRRTTIKTKSKPEQARVAAQKRVKRAARAPYVYEEHDKVQQSEENFEIDGLILSGDW